MLISVVVEVDSVVVEGAAEVGELVDEEGLAVVFRNEVVDEVVDEVVHAVVEVVPEEVQKS